MYLVNCHRNFWRWTVNGEHNWENGIAIGAGVLPGAGSLVGKAVRTTGLVEGLGFKSFPALKRYLGSPGVGNQWHHIVEQTPGNLEQFGSEVIQNTGNIIAIPRDIHIGKGSISAHYSSILPGTGGLTVRNWLSTQSFEAQFKYGTKLLEKYGIVR